jgi:hypothetical protein
MMLRQFRKRARKNPGAVEQYRNIGSEGNVARESR